MATPDSAVCNAERQLIICGYKPAPPRSRAPRMRKLHPRPGRPELSPQPDSAPRRAPARLDAERWEEERTGDGRGRKGEKLGVEEGRSSEKKASN